MLRGVGEVQGWWGLWRPGEAVGGLVRAGSKDWRALWAALRLRDLGQARPLYCLGWLDPLAHWASALPGSRTKGWP